MSCTRQARIEEAHGGKRKGGGAEGLGHGQCRFVERGGGWSQSSDGGAGLAGSREQRYPGELVGVLDQIASLRDQSSVSGVGGLQKKEDTAVRKESEHTQ